MKNVVIFAIDNGSSLHQQAKFLRHLDTMRAMRRLSAMPKCCIGFWEGQLERSYILPIEDYRVYVAQHGWVDGQHSVVMTDLHGQADLMKPDLSEVYQHLRVMRKISDPTLYKAWTFVEEEGQYYAA